jgi:hypothetical protein
MSTSIPRDSVVGATLQAIRHSPYSEPVFVLEGIGPATFRSHYLVLSTGIVLELSTGGILVLPLPADSTRGETIGLPVSDVLGKRITSMALDDIEAPVVILDGGLFLKDANDGCYGNPLFAGRIESEYDQAERRTFVDYWTAKPF